MATSKGVRRLPFDIKAIRRRPGQSAGEHWRQLLDKCTTDILTFLMFGFLILAISIFQKHGVLIPVWLGGVLFVVAIVVAVMRFVKVKREIRTWQYGENGEVYVGQTLEETMRPLGYDVFHDIQIEKPGRKMNLDHVLIGPNGVYLVETKFWRKPERGSPEIEYRDGCLYRAGVRVRDSPVVEAMALAKEANRYFHDLTGRSYYVKPILVFAGWYHRVAMTHESPILFLNEGRISSFLPRHNPISKPSHGDLELLKAKLSQVR